MRSNSIDHLKFPTGKYLPPRLITNEIIAQWIDTIATLPDRFIPVANSLTDEQLNLPYREGGWTAGQVIHHVPESHLNSYVRFKWALTEDNPTIKAYNEKAWTTTEELNDQTIESSLLLLEAIHLKLKFLLKSLNPEQLQRTFVHPESQRTIRLDWNIGLYAWHGDHHLGHLKLIQEQTK